MDFLKFCRDNKKELLDMPVTIEQYIEDCNQILRDITALQEKIDELETKTNKLMEKSE